MIAETQNPIFYGWALQKIKIYADSLPEEARNNPNTAPRKGHKPTGGYPFSMSRYEAAVYSVMHGRNPPGKKYRLNQRVLSLMENPPTSELLHVWRSEGRFRLMVEDLKDEFAEYIARSIFYGEKDCKRLPNDLVGINSSGLSRKVKIIHEAVFYPPDLIKKINSKMFQYINSDSNRNIGNYLGHHIWCCNLLKFPAEYRRGRRIYQNALSFLIGRVWPDEVLNRYILENESSLTEEEREKLRNIRSGVFGETLTSLGRDCWSFNEKWDFHLKNGNQKLYLLANGDYQALQNEFREELSIILKAEFRKIICGIDALPTDDLFTGIDFLSEYQGFFPDDFTAAESQKRECDYFNFIEKYKGEIGEVDFHFS